MFYVQAMAFLALIICVRQPVRRLTGMLNHLMVLVFPEDSPENQAYRHPQYTKEENKHSRPGALSRTEHGSKYAFCGNTLHKWLTDHIHHPSAKEPANGYCKKLQRIPAGIDSALHLGRYRGPHDNIQAGAHQRDRQISQYLGNAPCNRRPCQRHKKVICSQ